MACAPRACASQGVGTHITMAELAKPPGSLPILSTEQLINFCRNCAPSGLQCDTLLRDHALSNPSSQCGQLIACVCVCALPYHAVLYILREPLKNRSMLMAAR